MSHDVKLWRSGVILSVVGFLSGLGNYAFQGIIGKQLDAAEFGHVNSTLGFVNLLLLPLSITGTALVHYIAHFRTNENEADLRGLLAAYRQFLLKMTLGGIVVAVLLLIPLSRFFHYPGMLMVAASCYVVFGSWSGFVGAFCQGMAWFKRLALIGLVAVAMRLIFGLICTSLWPWAWVAVSATTFSFLAYLAVLFWRKDLFGKGEQVLPWNGEFLKYLLVTGACLVGGYCFAPGDLLVAQRHFAGEELGGYSAAGLLARAPAMVVLPLLTVLFTSRSGRQGIQTAEDQKVLLGLYAAGLGCGALGVILLRDLFGRMFSHQFTPEASAMVIRFTLAMFFVGLIQAIGIWSLASRWYKLTMLYGGLGLAYWLMLLAVGTTPERLLQAMPLGAGVAFLILVPVWLLVTRRAKSPGPETVSAASAPIE
jgi:O-antigen/teichoic acid export membrane protein